MIVYSATLLQVFSQTIIRFALLLLIAFICIWLGFRKNYNDQIRGTCFCIGLFILVEVVSMTINLSVSVYDGPKTVQALLDKYVVIDRGSEGGNQHNYYFEMRDQQSHRHKFLVSRDFYNALAENQCYSITYYPNDGLKSRKWTNRSYIYSEYIAKVILVDSPTCQ